MKGWFRVGSKGGALGVKKISCAMARIAKSTIEQLIIRSACSVSGGRAD